MNTNRVQLPSGKIAYLYPPEDKREPETLLNMLRLSNDYDAVNMLYGSEIDVRVVNGEIVADAKEMPDGILDELKRRGDRIKHPIILKQQERQDMGIERYNLPIKIFYSNMLHIGLKLKVVNGELKVGGNMEIVTPVIEEEIVKRAEHLIDLLTPAPCVEMARYFGRLLTLDQLKVALNAAQQLQEPVDAFPVNGGWILVTSKTAQVPA